MPQSKTRIGIIGCGQIAQQHMKSYGEIANAEIVACVDVNEAAAQRSADQYGIPNVYTSIDAMFERDDLDAVDVCLHNNFHATATIKALHRGLNVYCDKPMAGSYSDAAEMLRVAKQTKLKLHIQLSTLYSDETIAAKRLIEAGELGPLYHARSAGFRRRGRPYVDGYGTPTFVQKRNSSGGALYDMGVYHISRMLYLLDNPDVERISGKAYQRTPIDPTRQTSSAYDVEELGMGFVRLKGECTLDIIESWAIHMDGFGGSWIVGDLGGIRLDPFGFFKTCADIEMNATANLGSARYRWNQLEGLADHYANSQVHWIAALRGEVDLLPTAQIALNTMLISEGIYLSSARGCEVTAAEVEAASVSTALPL